MVNSVAGSNKVSCTHFTIDLFSFVKTYFWASLCLRIALNSFIICASENASRRQGGHSPFNCELHLQCWHGIVKVIYKLLLAQDYLTRLNKIATQRINSRWQVDKEAHWLIDSSTYLSKCTPPFLCICRFYL